MGDRPNYRNKVFIHVHVCTNDYYRIVVSAQHAVVVFSFNVGNDVGTD